MGGQPYAVSTTPGRSPQWRRTPYTQKQNLVRSCVSRILTLAVRTKVCSFYVLNISALSHYVLLLETEVLSD